MVSTNSASNSHPLDKAAILGFYRLYFDHSLQTDSLRYPPECPSVEWGVLSPPSSASRPKTLPKLEVLRAPGDAMTELFIAREG